MAVPAGPTEVRYVGNGVTTIFTIPFLLIVDTDLDVYVNGAPVTSGYTILGTGSPGSSITFSAAPVALADIYLVLDVPFERLNDYQENGDFLAGTVNRDFDRIWQALKQLQRVTVRALTLGRFDIDGQGWYRAKGNGIRDLRDPVDNQDAVTKRYNEQYIGGLISAIQGPINNSANSLYIDPYGTPRVVQDMSGPSGGRLIGHRDRDIGRKAEDVVSIQDFEGAVDDFNGTTGTNCYAALQAIFAAYPGGVIVRFPRTNTGRYLINGGQFSTLDGFVWDPDPGVTIHQVGLPSPMIAPGVRVTRQLPIRLSDEGYIFYLGPRAYGDLVEQSGFMAPDDGEAPVLFATNQNIATNSRIDWPNGPVSAASPSSSSPDATVWQPLPNNAFVLTSKSVRPGSEITAYLAVPAFSGQLIVGVITDAGFSIVRQDASGGAIQTAVKSGANPIVESAAITTALQELDNYRFGFGLLSVRVHSPQSYSVLINGTELVRVRDAGGVILQAGFGGGFATNTGSLAVAGMSVAKAVRAMGQQPQEWVVVGDSITDPQVPCSWVDYARQYVAGVGGTQVVNVKNLAVSGENSNQQTARLIAENITGYHYAFIQIGVNDIQQGISPATLTINLGTMINHCRAAGVVPIIGLPTMFYGATDAAPYGNIGQATLNNTAGAPYRATILRYLASQGVAVCKTLDNLGAVVPSLISGSDPVVMDNIHPTAYGRMLLGLAFAKAWIGQAHPREDKRISGRQAPAAWAVAPQGATLTPNYSVVGDLLKFGGALSVSTDPLPAGTSIMQLPEMFCPESDQNFVVPTAGGSGIPNDSAFLIVSVTGNITAYGVAAGTRFIYFGSVQYPIPT